MSDHASGLRASRWIQFSNRFVPRMSLDDVSYVNGLAINHRWVSLSQTRFRKRLQDRTSRILSHTREISREWESLQARHEWRWNTFPTRIQKFALSAEETRSIERRDRVFPVLGTLLSSRGSSKITEFRVAIARARESERESTRPLIGDSIYWRLMRRNVTYHVWLPCDEAPVVISVVSHCTLSWNRPNCDF